jgi:nucleoside-diphosphate-sugar epimerase
MSCSLSIGDRIRGRTILVTGAGGFIGSRIVKLLLEHGADVRAVVAAPGEPALVFKSDRLENRFAEITDRSAIEEAVQGVDIVVHAAGSPSVAASFHDPNAFVRAHVLGTVNVLEASRAACVRKFVYLSSAEIYGCPQAELVSEDQPADPRSPYGAAKASAELFVRAFVTHSDFSSIILRPFSVYGSGSSPGSLIATIAQMIRSSNAIELNTLKPIRDYCHVDDVANAVLRGCGLDSGKLVTLNIGSGKGISVGELATFMVQVAGKKVPVQERTDTQRLRPTDIQRLVANRARALETLGWEPAINLETGLRGCLV